MNLKTPQADSRYRVSLQENAAVWFQTAFVHGKVSVMEQDLACTHKRSRNLNPDKLAVFTGCHGHRRCQNIATARWLEDNTISSMKRWPPQMDDTLIYHLHICSHVRSAPTEPRKQRGSVSRRLPMNLYAGRRISSPVHDFASGCKTTCLLTVCSHVRRKHMEHSGAPELIKWISIPVLFTRPFNSLYSFFLFSSSVNHKCKRTYFSILAILYIGKVMNKTCLHVSWMQTHQAQFA